MRPLAPKTHPDARIGGRRNGMASRNPIRALGLRLNSLKNARRRTKNGTLVVQDFENACENPGLILLPILSCIKSRHQPNAPVEVGHRTATVCHLANIARELGRKLRWDPVHEEFIRDDEANRLVDRPRRKGFALPT